MIIGILSMQKIPNYGSFLQAYSLKKQLEKRGHVVYFIDIEHGAQIVEIKRKRNKIFSKIFDRYIFKRIENYFMFKKMLKIHYNDQIRYLQTDKKLEEGDVFDLVIVGSDEVFHCLAPSPWGFSMQLMGNISNAKKIVSYAASCGETNYLQVSNYGLVSILKECMGNFSSFSVRDWNTKDFVERLTGKKALLHLDPVFISDFDEEIKSTCRQYRKKYILVYAYANRISKKQEIMAIKKYAKENFLDIICIGQQQRWCKHNYCATAFELLSYVKNATCIITDTFHGAVFSIKYNKKFGVIVRESNKNKLTGLLKFFDLENRILNGNDYAMTMNVEVDYSKINNMIEEERSRAFEYIDSVLKGEYIE